MIVIFATLILFIIDFLLLEAAYVKPAVRPETFDIIVVVEPSRSRERRKFYGKFHYDLQSRHFKFNATPSRGFFVFGERSTVVCDEAAAAG